MLNNDDLSEKAFSGDSPVRCHDEENKKLVATYGNLDAEKVLNQFGKFAPYQMFIYSMANAAYFLFACETMIMSLITVAPDFHCDLTNAGIRENYTILNQCTVSNAAGEQFECGRTPDSLLVFNETEHITLVSEFGLVCSQAYWAQHGTSLFMIGSMISMPLLIQLADRYGRRLTFLLPLWVTVIMNLACCLAPSYPFFLMFRFLAGLATSGIGTIGFVIGIEAVSSSFRSISPLLGTLTWMSGYIFVGVLHLFITNWRWLYFAISVPGILTFGYYWVLPESLHWLITNQKTKQVSRYIQKSSRINKIKVSLHECQSSAVIAEINSETVADDDSSPKLVSTDSTEATTTVPNRTFLDILFSRKLVFHLILHCYIMIVLNFTYWALSLFSPDLHEDQMVGYFLSGLVEFPAGLISLGLLLYFGRRAVTFLALFGQTTSMLVAVLFPGKSTLSMLFPLLAKTLNTIAWTSEPLLVGEMAPTSLRNIFFGSVGFAGEIGSVVAPYLNVLKEVHESAPFLLISAMSLLAAVAVLCSPETKHKSMPQDVEDFDAGPVYNWIASKFRCHKKSNNGTTEDIERNTKERANLLPELILVKKNGLEEQLE